MVLTLLDPQYRTHLRTAHSAHEMVVLIAYAQKPPINVHADISCVDRGLMFVGVFIYFNTLCMRAAKARASLRQCTDSPELPLLKKGISTTISCAGSY